MIGTVRNRLLRLLALGALWALVLAVPPALLMAEGFSGSLAYVLLSAVLGGCVGALVAGRRAARVKSGGKGRIRAGFGSGLVVGLFGGAVTAAFVWALMAVQISGYVPGGVVEPAALMGPRAFLGSFFVSLSVFLYALAGGLLLGPLFGTLINRTAKGGGA